jgi:N-acetylneuraminic acid mutarotase
MMVFKLRQILLILAVSFILGIFALMVPGHSSSAQTENDFCAVVLSEWREGPQIPNKHLEGATALVDGKLYIFTGFETNTLVPGTIIDVYNPETGLWETTATPLKKIPFAATHLQAAVDGQYVWFAGGFTGKHPGPPSDSVWRYDTVNDSWLKGPNLPQKRAAGFFVRIGRVLHYGGGLSIDRDTNMSDHWALNIDNLAAGWQVLPSLPDARNHLSGVELEGKLYAVGGQYFHDHNPIDLQIMHIFDPATSTWTRGLDLLFNRSHFEPGTTKIGGRVIIVGGRNNQIVGEGRLSEVTLFDPFRNRWRELRELPVDLIAPVASVIGDQIIVTAGGSNWDIPQRDTYIADISYDCTPEPTTSAPLPTDTPVSQNLTLIQPSEGQTIHGGAQIFEWQALPDVTEYKIKFKGISMVYRAKKSFTPLDLVCSNSSCSIPLSALVPLPNKEQLLWRIIAKAPGVEGKSDWHHFFTSMPGITTLVAPENDFTLNPASPIFSWTPVAAATHFQLIVKDFEGNKVLKQTVAVADGICNETLCSVNGRNVGLQLTIGQNYRWKVKAISPDGGIKSETRSFRAIS